MVDGLTNEAVAEDIRIEIEDSFAEAATGLAGFAIVSHMRGQDGDSSCVGSAVAMVDVVPDGSCIDDQDRPCPMGVRWVYMVDERGMKDFGHAIESGVEGPDALAARIRGFANPVQDVSRWKTFNVDMSPVDVIELSK